MASSSSKVRNSTMSDIAGISLSVDKYGGEPAHLLTFYKNKTDVVLIGRRSSTSTRASGNEHDRALFRCPVISRRHAKITFTQYGNVYISDLSSHHGTHILRPGETVPKTISSDCPTVLADGDTLTFGKPVGKDDSLVVPVTARVRLLFSIPSTSSAQAQVSASVVEPTTPAAATPAVHPGASGRYGIYTPAMTSSGSESSSEDEIEEISPPPRTQLPPCSSFPTMHWGWSTPSFHFHHQYQPPHMQHPHHMHRAGPAEHSMPGRLGLLRRILPRLGSVEEISSHRGSTRMSPISISSDSRSPSIVEVPREAVASASIAHEVNVGDDNANSIAAPAMDDADEDMDLESEAPSEYSTKPIDWNINAAIDAANEAPSNSVSLLIASSRICTPEPPSPISERSDDSSDMYATPAPPALIEVFDGFQPFGGQPDFTFEDYDFGTPQLETPPREILPPVAEDQFASRVENLKSKLADLEQSMYVREQMPFPDSHSAATDAVVESSQAAQATEDKAAEAVAQDTSANAMMTNLKDMLQALDELRKKAEVDMANELEAIRAARIEAETAVAAARRNTSPEKTATASESPATLKRKRDELEPEDDDSTTVVPRPTSCQALFDKLSVEPPRKRKRSEPSARVAVAKRIAAGVVKTTVIAAVGAAATWSALAFS